MRYVLLSAAAALGLLGAGSLAAQVQAPLERPSAEAKPMTAAEFEALTTGKTMNYAANGQVFGTEFYKPGRRVLWAFTEDECHEGRWYPEGETICFAYADLDGPQCWLFFQDATGVTARFVGPEGPGNPNQVSQSSTPLTCLGPDVGV